MLSRVNKRSNQGGESGFTLIELLVVVIIIGILAAIAIPMYLSQRQKGWEATVTSDLRNAAVAAESWYTGNTTYVGADLAGEGYNASAGVTLAAELASISDYCLEATHSRLTDATDVWHYLGSEGEPADGGCPAALP